MSLYTQAGAHPGMALPQEFDGRNKLADRERRTVDGEVQILGKEIGMLRDTVTALEARLALVTEVRPENPQTDPNPAPTNDAPLVQIVATMASHVQSIRYRIDGIISRVQL